MTRTLYLRKIETAFEAHVVVILLGPPQCGATRLAMRFSAARQRVTRFDLAEPHDLRRLKDAESVFQSLSGLVFINDIQRRLDLMPVLIKAAKKNPKLKFLLVGHARAQRLQSETQDAVVCIEVTPLLLAEVDNKEKFWLRGGFPKSYAATSDQESYQWRQNYLSRLLEQDVRNLGYRVASEKLRAFWEVLSRYHAGLLNTSEIARELGVAGTIVNRYLDILSNLLVVRILRPWAADSKKRQIKTPKIYCRDAGVLHALLKIETMNALKQSQILSASWEGMALEAIIAHYQAVPENCYFWATHQGAGIDLLIENNNQRLGFCFCYDGQSKITRAMRIAFEDLNLDQLTLVVPNGDLFQVIDEKVFIASLAVLISG